MGRLFLIIPGDIPEGTLSAILKQAGVTAGEFLEAEDSMRRG